MSKQKKIPYFQGEYRWLSNFCACAIWFDNIHFSSVEAAYVAAKTPPKEKEMRKYIATLSAGKAKKFGKNELKESPYQMTISDDWNDEKRLKTMRFLLFQKFHKKFNPTLANNLIKTQDIILIEGNDWEDVFFGVDDTLGGKNHLGKLIMSRREELVFEDTNMVLNQ